MVSEDANLHRRKYPDSFPARQDARVPSNSRRQGGSTDRLKANRLGAKRLASSGSMLDLRGPCSCSWSALVGSRFVRTDDRRVRSCGLAVLLTSREYLPDNMNELSLVLAASNLAFLANATRVNRRSSALTRRRTPHLLIADLVAARIGAGMTQQEVARSPGFAPLRILSTYAAARRKLSSKEAA